ncbi:SusE domain-containing protein [Litoribaculum gwangyangense]|uniref:SusE outer membrane protein domain-containing protein n=1 Tax=Litoribaculum gwangyangense TaxID=1130722 RepID=A0ABP9CL18_9FLAO
MKIIHKYIVAIALVSIFVSCTDSENLYSAKAPENGSFEITSSVTNVILNETDAETETALTLSWNNPSYGVDTPVTYTLEMDLNDNDFSSPRTFSVTGNERVFTHADLNYYALEFGIAPNIEGQIKVRLKTSLKYGALQSYSNSVSVALTPYDTLNLLYEMPAELYLQGDAVPSNWGTPLPESQKMSQIDDHRFGLITQLVGGKSYAFISTPTTWSDPAYVALESGQSAFEGDFRPAGSMTVPQWGGSPLSSPSTTGIYKIIIDFTTGKYSVTSTPSLLPPPTDLYIIGDATPLGWAANVDATQKFTKISDYVFEITIPLTSGGAFTFITATSYSDPAYKTNTNIQDGSGGDIIASGSATNPAWGGDNIIAPSTGTFTIRVDFKSGTYLLIP